MSSSVVMDSSSGQEALTKMLSLLMTTVTCIDDYNKEDEENDKLDHCDETDEVEKVVKLLHLNNNNFSTLAKALDDLYSLNTAAKEYNSYVTGKIRNLNETQERIQTSINEFNQPIPHPLIANVERFLSSTTIPSETQLAKYEFKTAGLEEHLEKIKVFPYYHSCKETNVSKRLASPRKNRASRAKVALKSEHKVADVNELSDETDAVFTLQTFEEMSRLIVQLRQRNDIIEDSLNRSYNYKQNCHLLDLSSDNMPETLIINMTEECDRLELECLKLEEELARKVHSQDNNYDSSDDWDL